MKLVNIKNIKNSLDIRMVFKTWYGMTVEKDVLFHLPTKHGRYSYRGLFSNEPVPLKYESQLDEFTGVNDFMEELEEKKKLYRKNREIIDRCEGIMNNTHY